MEYATMIGQIMGKYNEKKHVQKENSNPKDLCVLCGTKW